jgi:hypothetical protein
VADVDEVVVGAVGAVVVFVFGAEVDDGGELVDEDGVGPGGVGVTGFGEIGVTTVGGTATGGGRAA